MRLHVDMALPLLAIVLGTFICSEGALLRKTSAVDFLSGNRDRRSPRCLPSGCSAEDSEAEELPEANEEYEEILKNKLSDGSKPGQNLSPDDVALNSEGSGM